MPDRSVRISGDPWNPRVEVDGQDISKAVRSVTVRYERGHRARVEIEFLADTVEVGSLDRPYAETVLSLPPGVEDALTALGWTPPDMCAGGCR